jgi:hypothetical protein
VHSTGVAQQFDIIRICRAKSGSCAIQISSSVGLGDGHADRNADMHRRGVDESEQLRRDHRPICKTGSVTNVRFAWQQP